MKKMFLLLTVLMLVGSTAVFAEDPKMGGGDSIIKGWINFDGTTNPPTINTSYNVDSVDDLGAGKFRVNWDNDFTSATYAAVASSNGASSNKNSDTALVNKAAGSVEVWTVEGDVVKDKSDISVIAIGDLL